MKDKSLNGEASGRIVGRGFIIAVVVVFSSLSFTFGYFVGKNHPQMRADSVAQVVSEPAASRPQQNAAVSSPQSTPESRPSGEESRLQEKKVPEQAVPSPTQSRPVSDKASVGHTETASTVAKEKSKENPEGFVGAADKSASNPTEKDVTYAVQVGALKNAAEARSLKAKYVKKGYKTSIAVSHGKHKEKTYKVRIGEFKEKKEAEILALRLKKNEGLSAFVTVKGN